MVHARVACGAEALIQALPDQRVSEGEPSHPLWRLGQNRGGHGDLEQIQHCHFRHVNELRDQRDLELIADHGTRQQHLQRFGTQPLGAATDDIANARRQAQRRPGLDTPALRSSSNTNVPDSNRLRRISATKNGLPPVSPAISPANATPCASIA